MITMALPPSPFKTKEFKDLQKKWYNKLRSHGFRDAEQNEVNLQQYHSRYYQDRYSPQTFQENQRYFELAGQLLNDSQFKWKNGLEKAIWQRHSQGKGTREIGKRFKLSHTSVEDVIKRIAKYIKV